MEELKYKKVEEVIPNSKLVLSGAFKPFASTAIIIVVGLALLIFAPTIWFKGLGAFFIAIAAFVLFFVKDKKTIDIYETGCVIYHTKDQNLAYFLDFNDVEEWDVIHESGHDTIEFTLQDKNRAVVDTFQTNKIYNALDKVIPEKQHLVVLKKRNKELNVSPVDAIKNLMAKKKK